MSDPVAADQSVSVGAKRTPIGAFLGQFTGVPTPTLGATAIRAALAQAGVAPDQVSEVIMGCVLPAGLGLFWCLVDRDDLTWHDRLSRTRLVVVPRDSLAQPRPKAGSHASR